MLFILSGNVQCGKTRWLQSLIAELGQAAVACDGVLAPGVWREDVQTDGSKTYQKLAIENVLLPQNDRLTFGVWGPRHNGETETSDGGSSSQSRRARLAWDISDEAIGRVNAHFDALASIADSPAEPPARRLLVVDELGRLELLHNGGLTSAAALLDRGPTPRWLHAIVVVRTVLVDAALERFSRVWPIAQTIGPNDDGRSAILSAVLP